MVSEKRRHDWPPMPRAVPPIKREPSPDQGWRARAACRDMDTDIFFPPRGDVRLIRAAKAICATCPVRVQCLDYAISDHYLSQARVGVFGGTTEKERRGLRRAKRLSA